MYGLPETTDLGFLRGLTLTEISIAPFSTILWFGSSTKIVVETDMVAHVAGQRVENRASVVATLVPCLGIAIDEIVWDSRGTLRLSFTGRDLTLEIRDDSDSYESYAIHSGEQIIVV